MNSERTIRKLLAGSEDAYHLLLEAEAHVDPTLVEMFQNSDSDGDRAVLLELIWQRNAPGAEAILNVALADRSSCVWREALDGLVSLRSIGFIRAALAECDDPGKRGWLSEALQQLVGAEPS